MAESRTPSKIIADERPVATDLADAIRSFAHASVEVALDCTPFADDDHAWSMFGIPVSEYATDDPRAIIITTTTGRRFALAFGVSEIPSHSGTYCKLHDRWEASARDDDHTPAPDAVAPDGSDLATNADEGGTLCTFTFDRVTCGHTAAVHVNQGAVASDRGPWCQGCDNDPERVDVNELVHHEYEPRSRALVTFGVLGDDPDEWRAQVGTGSADIYSVDDDPDAE